MRKQVSVFYQNKPAIEIALQRTENADSLVAAEVLEQWLDENSRTKYEELVREAFLNNQYILN